MKCFATALLAGVFALGVSAQEKKSPDTKSSAEVRVFLLEKASGKAADITGMTAILEIEPKGGTKRTLRMEAKNPMIEGNGKERKPGDEKKPDEERKAPDLVPAAGKMTADVVCGQVKDLDKWYVELVVLGSTAPRPGALHGKGFKHDHGSAYFCAALDDAALSDMRGKAVNFKANVLLDVRGDKKTVSGFEYPWGTYEYVIGTILDNTLKRLENEIKSGALTNVKPFAEKVKMSVHALPPLTFKKDEDRREFETALSECMTACDSLASATTQEAAQQAVDRCQETCNKVRSEAKDAEGAHWVW